LYLTPGCFDKGGISRYSRYQIAALRQVCGPQNVRAFSLLGPDTDGFEHAFEVAWHGSGRFGSISNLDRATFAARAASTVLSWRPDLIFSAHVNFAPLLTRLGQLARAPTVLNVYGLEIWSDLTPARAKHMKRADHIVSDCHFTARYVQDERLHADPPTVIWDPVDLDRFCPGPPDRSVGEKYGLPDPDTHAIVMSLGRLAKAAAHKGFDRLIPVFASLAPEHPDLRLVIAGRGDDRPRLEALCAECGIADRVVFTGPIDEADLPALYRFATAFSLVSDRGHGRGEGIPLTPLEAMACGAPIIVGNEDGSQEAVVEERNGFVVSPRSPEAHRTAIATLLQNKALRVSMAAEARAVAETHFSFDGFVEKHRALLTALASKSVQASWRKGRTP